MAVFLVAPLQEFFPFQWSKFDLFSFPIYFSHFKKLIFSWLCFCFVFMLILHVVLNSWSVLAQNGLKVMFLTSLPWVGILKTSSELIQSSELFRTLRYKSSHHRCPWGRFRKHAKKTWYIVKNTVCVKYVFVISKVILTLNFVRIV